MKYHLLSILSILTITLGIKNTAQADTSIYRSNYQILAKQISNLQLRSSTDSIINVKSQRLAIDSQSSSTMTIESLELSVYQQINQYRQSQNLPPLTIDPIFAARARMHSQEMAKKGQLSHIIDSAAFQRNYPTAAENVASSRDYPSPDLLAVQDWISSPAHQKNAMGNYNLTGIGVAKNAQGEYYFTQIFIQKYQ
jgi:uncharacterized protein YkwD